MGRLYWWETFAIKSDEKFQRFWPRILKLREITWLCIPCINIFMLTLSGLTMKASGLNRFHYGNGWVPFALPKMPTVNSTGQWLIPGPQFRPDNSWQELMIKMLVKNATQMRNENWNLQCSLENSLLWNSISWLLKGNQIKSIQYNAEHFPKVRKAAQQILTRWAISNPEESLKTAKQLW